ncbi:MAG: RNA polymerase sigma factor [Gemmataceae bacterium]
MHELDYLVCLRTDKFIPMDTTPLSLLHRLRQPQATEPWSLFERLYRPWLRGQILRLVPAGEAEDLLQEVFLVLMREVPLFQHNGQKGAFRCWLRRLVVHRVQEFWKARDRAPLLGRDYQLLCEQLADDHDELSQQWDQEHDRYIVGQLLKQIANDFEAVTWQAFRAFVLEKRSAAEVARALGVSEGAVWTAKSRVLRRLRQVAQDWIE